MRLDARRPLEDLHYEWSQCTKCDLGVRRKEVGGAYVRGEGALRGIMIVGEGPGKTEEQLGRPFVGKSGQLLRRVLEQLNVTDVCYITNIVSCRSCVQRTDEKGEPMFSRRGGILVPKYQDRPPSPVHIATCLPRFYEEVYIVDPLIIVTLGATAASTLLRHSVSILADSGTEEHMEVPGVAQVPVFTDKKKDWVRNLKERLVAPTTTNMVRYLTIPTLHPAFVARAGGADHSDSSPLRKFCNHLKLAAVTFSKVAEYYGITLINEVREDIRLEDVDSVEEDEYGSYQ